MDHEQALTWYLKGYELLKTVKPRNFEVLLQLITACEKLVREYSHRQNPEAIIRYRDENLRFTTAIMKIDERELSALQKQSVSIRKQYFLLECVRHALRDGRVEDARELYKPIGAWMKDQVNLRYRESQFKEVYIEILIRAGELEDAERIARENAASALLYRGEKYKDYLTSLENLADVLALEKKAAEAFSIYEEVLTRLQRGYPDDRKWAVRIMDKMAGKLNDKT